ncbi:hypothetical protein ACRAWD_14045 [Caulobacter segnis]
MDNFPKGRWETAGEARKAAILKGAPGRVRPPGAGRGHVEAIARAAGISKANFSSTTNSSKEALYVAVLEQGLAQWLALLSRFTPDDDPEQAIASP